MRFKRIILIILDSLGVGEAKDANLYNDIGANTLGSIYKHTNLTFPNIEKMGLKNIINNQDNVTSAYYTYAKPISIGKDTLTGHLEIMGLETTKPFKTFTDNGFPKSLVSALEESTGHKFIGNCSASGTQIIEDLGPRHIETKELILYTSADSVMQIAAHEEVIPLEELYRVCEIARKLTLKDEWKVGRIIARPFIGEVGNFVRTSNRHDYALDPFDKTVLDYLKESYYDVISIGKISDIFNRNGITKTIKTKDNNDGINTIIDVLEQDFNGLCFANLNDFDSKYGHRRDIIGYGNCLLEFDNQLPHIINKLQADDLLIIMADHGNDPGYRDTDHTRENVPVLIYSNQFKESKQLPPFETFGDIGATIAYNFNVSKPKIGINFLDKLK
ncbi:MAG: phosphopentomutase [Bacilli bacterium]|nr:phosphopentomutase [Bacilli bacterium]MDD4809396.1 phosphopentomutase [Bacilli bacterium]